MSEWKWSEEDERSLAWGYEARPMTEGARWLAKKLRAALAELARREAALYILHDGRCWSCGVARKDQVERASADVGVELFATPPTPAPGKIKITLDDATRLVWETAQAAKAEVASWPAWKRGDAAGAAGPQFTLCEDTAMLAVNGACPAHNGDACLREFVPMEAPAVGPTDGPIKLPVSIERQQHLAALIGADGDVIIRREDGAIIEQIADALNAQAKR